MSVDESVDFFSNIPTIKDKLLTLQKVGLGYMKMVNKQLHFLVERLKELS